MSEKRARRERLEKQAQGAQPPPQAEQPGNTTTVADLLQLLGAKDVEIYNLQKQVAGLTQQVQTLAEQLAKKEEKKEKS